MDATHGELSRVVPASRLLGWLNFSDGRPDPKWQRQLDDAFHVLVQNGVADPWVVLRAWLEAELVALQASDNAAFRDATQARAALDLVFSHALPAYRHHHRDLLSHLSDEDLFVPFFVARVCEAVLSQGAPWDERERIVEGAIKKLNDYVGHRPVAVLERRTRPDVYPHEKVRPVPIYIKGAGAALGPYHEMVTRALEMLRETDPEILQDASLDPDAIDELAYDPRAYDHGHPVNRRPNYLFGEWDPHQIDVKGKFRRFVVRHTTLEAILTRLPGGADPELLAERKYETAAVLAGTILMASGTSGSGPTTFDSNITLSKLVPRIARYRDAFYKRLITSVGGTHGEKLREEATRMRQPFASARQHLNQELARQRAVELQESLLAMAFAEMGYPEASRRRAAKIPAVSVRMLSEIRVRLTQGQALAARGRPVAAAKLLRECEHFLHRGIECGALADPWNALGFQGLFPLFTSREDSVRDPRLDDLIDIVSRIFHLYADVLSAAAAKGKARVAEKLMQRLTKLARWWDRHATYEVSDLPRVHGAERAEAAVHVAQALAGVRTSDANANDMAYWRQQRDGFQAPAAFAQVVDALMRQQDHRPAMGLLMTWLSEAGLMPLEEGEASFHALAKRWLRDVTEAPAVPPPSREGPVGSPADRIPLVLRFLELLEANADEFWGVPEWTFSAEAEEEGEDRFDAAYEGMSFRDSADDGREGALLGGAPDEYFPLEDEAERLEGRLDFLTTVAELWRAAAEFFRPYRKDHPAILEAMTGWLATARAWQGPLLELLDGLHDLKIPEPVGGFEDVMEYDRRRLLREQLAESVIETCVELGRAVRLLAAATGERQTAPRDGDPDWAPQAVRLEAELGRGNVAGVRRVLPSFVEKFRSHPMLFVPMSAGGHPRQILRSRQAQAMIRTLLEQLPRFGLIRETFHLIKLARTMEQNATAEGRKISEFDHLFPIALQSSLEALLDAAHSWPSDEIDGEEGLVDLLRRITDSFLSLWLAHAQTLRLSILESVTAQADRDAVREFIKTYGGDLFTPQFLALANLRSVLHRGVASWLDSLSGTPDAPKLVEDLDEGKFSRRRAAEHLEFIVQATVEHHEEYRDYNSTTTQSDYGENLHYLLDFLKIKVDYERYAWRMKPLVQAHAVLCRRGQDDAALRWQASMAGFTEKQIAEPLLEELSKLEREHGLRLRTIRDRLEERFVQPLVIDRLCSFIEPAMREAADPPAKGAFTRLEAQLRTLTDKPLGIGLEPPDWLQRVEDEVHRVRDQWASGERPPRRGLAPGVSLPYAELERQLDEWERPL
jgi:hypothetical protein